VTLKEDNMMFLESAEDLERLRDTHLNRIFYRIHTEDRENIRDIR